MIVAMTALYHALRGKKVDIFTSSAVLAETETGPGTESTTFINFLKLQSAIIAAV